MRIPVQLKNAPSNDPKWQSLQQIYQQAAKVINGNVNLIPQNAPALTIGTPLPGDNVANAHAMYITGTPGTDDIVIHNLNRLPFGYHVEGKTATVDVFDSPTPNTTTNLYLRSTVAGVTVKIMVY